MRTTFETLDPSSLASCGGWFDPAGTAQAAALGAIIPGIIGTVSGALDGGKHKAMRWGTTGVLIGAAIVGLASVSDQWMSRPH